MWMAVGTCLTSPLGREIVKNNRGNPTAEENKILFPTLSAARLYYEYVDFSIGYHINLPSPLRPPYHKLIPRPAPSNFP